MHIEQQKARRKYLYLYEIRFMWEWIAASITGREWGKKSRETKHFVPIFEAFLNLKSRISGGSPKREINARAISEEALKREDDVVRIMGQKDHFSLILNHRKIGLEGISGSSI